MKLRQSCYLFIKCYFSFAINNPNCILFCYNLDFNDLIYSKIDMDVIIINKYLKRKKMKGKVIFLNCTKIIYSKKLAVFTIWIGINIFFLIGFVSLQ